MARRRVKKSQPQRELFAAPEPAPAPAQAPASARAGTSTPAPPPSGELFPPPPAPRPKPQPPPRAPSPPVEVTPARALAAVRWLLAPMRQEPPEWKPGELVMHTIPMTFLGGRAVPWWQILRMGMDPDAHRVLALVRAAPVSMFPGAWRWIPLGELVLLRLHAPLWEYVDPPGVPALPETIRAFDQKIRNSLPGGGREDGFAVWPDIEAAADQRPWPSKDDPTGELLTRAGLQYAVPGIGAGASSIAAISPDGAGWGAYMVDELRKLGATDDALRRLLIEAGWQGGRIAELAPV